MYVNYIKEGGKGVPTDGDVMRWTALREDENGNTFTASFEMNRVEE